MNCCKYFHTFTPFVGVKITDSQTKVHFYKLRQIIQKHIYLLKYKEKIICGVLN